MRILFDYFYPQYMEDNHTKFGIGWYRHHREHKWFGLTVDFYLPFIGFNVTFVSDIVAYNKRMNFRYSDYIMKKREARLAKEAEEAAKEKK